MKIAGLQKLTLLDFPGHIACTVFLAGCNFRCPFCHNAPLVLGQDGGETGIPEEEFFAFLKKRQGTLEGVCITGGEPLLRDITEFVKQIRALGFLVKVDTNGSYPDRLRALIEEGLVDYVAMDVKNSLARYGETVGIPAFDTRPVEESIRLLKEGRMDYEFRTTVCREYHTAEDFAAIADLLCGARRYFLQTYSDEGEHVGGKLTAYNKEETEAFLPLLAPKIDTVLLRGV